MDREGFENYVEISKYDLDYAKQEGQIRDKEVELSSFYWYYSGRADFYFYWGYYNKALSDYNRALKIYNSPTDSALNNVLSDIKYRIAKTYAYMGYFDMAISVMKEVEKEYYLLDEFQYVLGIINFKFGYFDDSIKCFSQAIENSDNDVNYYFYRGKSYFSHGENNVTGGRKDKAMIDFECAIADFKMVIEISKDNIDLKTLKNRAYYREALAHEQKAIIRSLANDKEAVNDYKNASICCNMAFTGFLDNNPIAAKRMAEYDSRVTPVRSTEELLDITKKLMESREMLDIEMEVYKQEAKIKKFLSEKHRLADYMMPEFHILQRWNSYTPIISGNNNLGGGYYIDTGAHGIVIDPGFNFISNFKNCGFTFSDIDYVFITHAHNDHTADLESLLTLLYKYNDSIKGDYYRAEDEDTIYGNVLMNHPKIVTNSPKYVTESDFNINVDKMYKASGRRKKLKIFLTASTFKKYANILDLHKKQDYEIIVINDKITNIEIDELKIIPIIAKHDDIISDKEAVGFEFKYKNNIVLYTGDTGFSPEIEKIYKELVSSIPLKPNKYRPNVILLAHIGGFKRRERERYFIKNFDDGKAFYPNHLGRLGLIMLCEIVKPQMCIISEFGEEFKGKRVELSDMFKQYLNDERTYFAADIGLSFRMNGDISAVVTDLPVNQESVSNCFRYIPSAEVDQKEEDGCIYYFERGIASDIAIKVVNEKRKHNRNKF